MRDVQRQPGKSVNRFWDFGVKKVPCDIIKFKILKYVVTTYVLIMEKVYKHYQWVFFKLINIILSRDLEVIEEKEIFTGQSDFY